MNDNQRFNETLERYIFNTTAKIIGQVATQDQTKLMDLLNTVNKPLSVENKPTAHSIDILDEKTGKLTIGDLGTSECSREETVEHSIHSKKRKIIFYRSIEINQKEIEDTILCIRRIENLIDKAKQNIKNDYLKTRMVDRLHYLKLNYTTRLAQLEAFQQEKLTKINEYIG